MNSNKISLIYPRAGNGILKQGVTTPDFYTIYWGILRASF